MHPRLQIAKVRLSSLVSISAGFGYLLKSPEFSSGLFYTTAGVLMLACGAATMNNIQDADKDRLFARTRRRAIPQHQISLKSAFVQSLLLILTGAALLSLATTSPVPLIVGIISVLLYNVLYTPMKYHTIWAIVPGTLCGMLPPYIGWLSAGGDPLSATIMVCMALMGIWQIPHYWILLIAQRADYLKNRQIYSIVSRFSLRQLKHMTFTWVVAFCFLSLLFPLVGVADRYPPSRYLLLINAVLLIFVFFKYLLKKTDPPLRRLFLHINIALTAIMLISGIDSMI